MEIDPNELIPDGGLTGSVLNADPSTGLAVDAITSLKSIGLLILGLAVITCMIFFVIYITKLGAAGGEAKERKTAITGILVSGISLALLGGIGTVLGFFWGILK